MADDPLRNTLGPEGAGRSTAEGDVPAALRRRYLTEQGRGGSGLGFYVDATVVIPSFRDRGRQLVATRTDPAAIRDMAAIARHRGWSAVVAKGGLGFRREAWLAGRTIGLEVRGYRPSERDLQVLERRLEARARHRPETRAPEAQQATPSRRHDPQPTGARLRLRIVEAVVRDRISDPTVQASILAAARTRIADLLERGARFGDLPARDRAAAPRERRR